MHELAQNRACEIDVDTIEELSCADQPEQAAVKGQDRQSIETFGGGMGNDCYSL
jgi:hypothetical protein